MPEFVLPGETSPFWHARMQTCVRNQALRQEGQAMEMRMIQHVESEASRWTATMKGDYERVSNLGS